MLQPYLPILLLVAFVIANAVLMLAVSHVFSTYRRTPTKIAPYENKKTGIALSRGSLRVVEDNPSNANSDTTSLRTLTIVVPPLSTCDHAFDTSCSAPTRPLY